MVRTGQPWEKSAAADLRKLGSGIGKLGLFCTEVTAEIKGLHLSKGGILKTADIKTSQ